MIEALQREIYEHPLVVATGPQWSVVLAGYGVMDLFGTVYVLPAGERYLESLENPCD